MSGNGVENHIAVAITAMEAAKSKLLPLYDKCYPHMFTDDERREWTQAIVLARENMRQATYNLERLLEAPVLRLQNNA